MIVKNTYGQSVGYSVNHFKVFPKDNFVGSAKQRKKQETKSKKPKTSKDVKSTRKLSDRSKRKIRKKLTCFARCYKKLSFVTLTFLNQVSDEVAVDTLRKFIDNVKKRSKDFQYLWVAERQTKNSEFPDNVHFHLVTNKYWDIEKWWNYWIDLQKKNGILPRSEDFKPSSAFDVKQISSNNIRTISSYITKYITKNKAEFKCQVWNCSRKVSHLYTDFYTTIKFIENFEKLKAIKKIMSYKDHSDNEMVRVHYIDLNNKTIELYRSLDSKNKAIVNEKS
jgi:hypothetical protein